MLLPLEDFQYLQTYADDLQIQLVANYRHHDRTCIALWADHRSFIKFVVGINQYRRSIERHEENELLWFLDQCGHFVEEQVGEDLVFIFPNFEVMSY